MLNRSGIWAYSASVAGARHLRRGVERQDRAFHRVEAGFAISVVSDGAGSARNAALGATVSTTRATSAATWRLLDLAAPPTALRKKSFLMNKSRMNRPAGLSGAVALDSA